MEPTALPPAATRTDPAPRLGTRLPDTKLVLVTVALDVGPGRRRPGTQLGQTGRVGPVDEGAVPPVDHQTTGGAHTGQEHIEIAVAVDIAHRGPAGWRHDRAPLRWQHRAGAGNC